MEKTKVYLDNKNKIRDGIYCNKFPNDGSDINIAGKKRILIYSCLSEGLLEAVFNNQQEAIVIEGENNSIEIPEHCDGVSFQLTHHEFRTARFVFEVI